MELNKIHNIDCLEFMKTLPDKCIDLVLTDPPYLVDWQSNRRSVKHKKIENDNDDNWLEPTFKEIARVMKDDSLCISFYGWPEAEKFLKAWKGNGLKPKSHMVWIKNNIGLGWFTRGQHEQMYLLSKGKPQKPLVAISDVIYANGTGNEFHPTQKPVSLMEILVKAFSKEGNIIFDPFAGGGSTLIACKTLNRNYIGCEISPEYCKIAEERIKSISNTLFT